MHGSGKRVSGFTLVELLVVVSIIALLMAILMPALRKARRNAQGAICKSNLKQWGVLFNCYAADWDGMFFKGSTRVASTSVHWYMALWGYEEIRENFDFWCCPTATKIRGENVQHPFMAWSASEQLGWYIDYDEEIRGSYGMNQWCADEQNEFRGPRENYWRTFYVNGAARVPLFLDAVYSSSWARDTDEPWEYELTMESFGMLRESINRYLVGRHGRGAVNILYLDSSVRMVNLPYLWQQKWHRNFDTDVFDQIVWPAWLQKMK